MIFPIDEASEIVVIPDGTYFSTTRRLWDCYYSPALYLYASRINENTDTLIEQFDFLKKRRKHRWTTLRVQPSMAFLYIFIDLTRSAPILDISADVRLYLIANIGLWNTEKNNDIRAALPCPPDVSLFDSLNGY